MTQVPDDPLSQPIQFVRGVGPKRAELLARLGLTTVADVLWYLPRDVLDLTQVSPVADLVEGEMRTVRGRVVDLDGRTISHGRTMSAVMLDCDGDYLRALWFNQNWVLNKFQHQDVVLFSGKAKRKNGRWEMSHPRIQWLDSEDSQAHGGVLPRYGLTEGLAMHDMRRLTRQVAEEFAAFVPELLPESFRQAQRLAPVADALRGIHAPESLEAFQSGQRRLIFQDLLEFQLGLALRRRAWGKFRDTVRCPTTAKIDARIRRLLPFQLTAGQNHVLREISGDLDSGSAMHRLLQADVGAGKTVVAIYAMLVVVAAGLQAVLMAPTELLARQHWKTVDQILQQSRVQRRLLVGKLSDAERRETLQRIATGEIQLVIGTQALIQKDVEFARLGLLVIDEQHKFGVLQRAHFAGRAQTPHTLVMTATPIPRSLCLTQFGDLDLSIMSELPPGRQRVITSRVAAPPAVAKAWNFFREKIRSGRQGYVVCPRIETGPGTDPDSLVEESAVLGGGVGAVEMWKSLSVGELQGFRLGLLHGQLPSDEKIRVMEEFRRGELDVLVCTTVVEVGVDVPNATCMMIWQAERFGMSQLHQLRGRIARGHFQGYCFLASEVVAPDVVARLQALEAHASGFDVAEADFAFRGPGDVLGTRQHGALPLRVADLVRDQAVLLEAREAARDLVFSEALDQPEFAALKRQVLDRFGNLLEIAATG